MIKKEITVIIKDGEDEYRCTLRRPDVSTLSRANKLSKADEILAAQELVKGCWVDGDKEILEDGYLLVTAASQMGALQNGITAELKNE